MNNNYYVFISENYLVLLLITNMFFAIGYFYQKSEREKIAFNRRNDSEINELERDELIAEYEYYSNLQKSIWYYRGIFSKEVFIAIEPLKDILSDNPIMLENYFDGYRKKALQMLLFLSGCISNEANMTEVEKSELTSESNLAPSEWTNFLRNIVTSEKMILLKNNLSKYKIEFSGPSYTDDDDQESYIKIYRTNTVVMNKRVETNNSNFKFQYLSTEDIVYVGILDYVPENVYYNNLSLPIKEDLSLYILFDDLLETYEDEEVFQNQIRFHKKVNRLR